MACWVGIVTAAVLAWACSGVVKAQGNRAGELVDGRTYRNAALGMTMTLPGQWRLTPSVTADAGASKPEPGCDGPLCGKPQINVVLQATTNASQRISMIAYQLAAAYLDRKRYPLKQFAETMTTGSLGGSGFVPDGVLMAIQLGGKRGYRLMAKRVDSNAAAFGYVGESNGYVFLLVGMATIDPESLRAAIEGLGLEAKH